MSTIPFDPRVHGFHFRNDFVNRVIDLPGGGSLETYGRCGGMAYASLDYWHAGLPAPAHAGPDFPGDAGVPPDGTALADALYDRLLDSYKVLTALKFVTWTIRGDASTAIARGVPELTRAEELPRVMRAIDEGRPAVLGLIAATSLSRIGDNHQVVAYGYQREAGTGSVALRICDSNEPDAEVLLHVEAGPGRVLSSTGEAWRGFFVQDWQPKAPAYRDLGISEGVGVSDLRPVPGAPFSMRFTVRNDGDFPVRPAGLAVALRGPGGGLEPLVESPCAGPLPPGATATLDRTVDALLAPPGPVRLVACWRSPAGALVPLPSGGPTAWPEVEVIAG